jgi:hypothetical protein
MNLKLNRKEHSLRQVIEKAEKVTKIRFRNIRESTHQFLKKSNHHQKKKIRVRKKNLKAKSAMMLKVQMTATLVE